MIKISLKHYWQPNTTGLRITLEIVLVGIRRQIEEQADKMASGRQFQRQQV